ncbi:MAG: sigma-70 family RNA polymerase sigma factor [Clostridia bacterium]|nr:sigma-70 family RNA polymerase sigma factor [Clostridia bacterium]
MNNDYVLRLYDEYAQDVFRFACSYLNSYHDAQDIVHNLFLKLLKNNYRISDGKEKSYILKMTANLCKDFLKSGVKQNEKPFEILPESENRVSDRFEKSELLCALENLPGEYRTVIHLHFYEDLTVKETARVLKLTQSCVSMRLTRAKSMLKELLKEDENEKQI